MQRDSGARWVQGDYRISDEHGASAAVETVVAMLAGSFEMPDDATYVIVACAEGDDHSLPARMVAAYLVYLGWRVRFLGASVPARDLGPYLRDEQPAALLLSCSATPALVGARESIREAHAAGVPVIAGGRAFGEDSSRAEALGADAWLSDARSVDILMKGWQPDITASQAGARPSDDAEAILEAVPGVVHGALLGDLGGVSRRSVREDLELLMETLAAAVLVGDPQIVEEVVFWQRTRHVSQDDVMAPEDLVELALARLPEGATDAHTILRGIG